MGYAEQSVALRPGPHSVSARHHAVAAAPAGELFRSARGGIFVGAVAELVAEFAPRFRPANDLAGAEGWRLTLTEFSAAVQGLGEIEAEVAGGLQRLLTDR